MTTEFEHLRLKPSEDCIAREVGGETVLLDLARGTYFGLNATGTHIWQLLADGASADEVVSALQQTYDLPRQQLEADIRGFVSDLLENGIAVPREPGTDAA